MDVVTVYLLGSIIQRQGWRSDEGELEGHTQGYQTARMTTTVIAQVGLLSPPTPPRHFRRHADIARPLSFRLKPTKTFHRRAS